jgi:ElaB/YqjD/DUF883 family membrane-anchored ribosome-binding protein
MASSLDVHCHVFTRAKALQPRLLRGRDRLNNRFFLIGVPTHRQAGNALLHWGLPSPLFIQKAPMSDQKSTQEKIAAIGSGIAGNVNEAVEAAKPAMHHMADCIREEWHGLGESSHHMSSQLRQKLEKEAQHARNTAAHFIHHAPFNAVLIAAGTGAATALLVSWFMRSRQH